MTSAKSTVAMGHWVSSAVVMFAAIAAATVVATIVAIVVAIITVSINTITIIRTRPPLITAR